MTIQIHKFTARRSMLIIALLLATFGIAHLFTAAQKQPEAVSAKLDDASEPTVELNETQLNFIKVAPVKEYLFANEREAIGSIDFDQDKTVQLSPPYQGRIIDAFAKTGDEVKKGQTIYTIESADLVQAESTLITTAGVYELTGHVFERAKSLAESQGVPRKELDQAASDRQAAEGAFKAARAAMHVFGKTDAEIDRIIAERRMDSAMAIISPIDGRVTARNAAPGMLVQPGTTPAPYAVADLSQVWLLANIAERDIAAFETGQAIKVNVAAYPGRAFTGVITTIGASVDAATHRSQLRSEISDPNHVLRPGMLASFLIRTGNPVRAAAVPESSAVREGDGTMTVWATKDRRHFFKRTVEIGQRQDGVDQVVKGLKTGDQVAAEGALYLDNALAMDSQ